MTEINLGPLEQISPGTGKDFLVGDLRLAVFRTSENRLFATQALCPHANGPLAEGLLGARRIICPQHQWKFDLESGQCVGGEPAQLRTYPVEERGGEIYLTICEA